jgi:L-threonylcarbamoyladenylate synthase
MAFSEPINRAARILRSGGVVAYPTEGVYGLGCLPDDFVAVSRVLDMKERDPALGLVLIATDIEQLHGWIELPGKSPELTSSSDKPITWIVPATDDAPYWIRGEHSGLAVRMTTHPIAGALCDAADSALVSTSANVHGRPPTRSVFVLRRRFGALVDYIVPGACGPASGPSEIRELASGKVLRSA